jgi:hypothetical protein
MKQNGAPVRAQLYLYIEHSGSRAFFNAVLFPNSPTRNK